MAARKKKAEPKVRINTQDILNWIFGGAPTMPQSFIENKAKLTSVSPYVTESLWNYPKIIHYLNEHINDLHNIPDPVEYLFLIRKIFTAHGIQRSDLRFSRFNPPDKLVDEIEKNLGYDEGNARSKAMMIRLQSQDDTLYKQITPTKANLKKSYDPDMGNIIDNIILEDARNKPEPELAKHYIDPEALTQDYIEQEELVLFDTSLLKKSNRVLLIFIDKNNHKKYCLKPFKATIYISKIDGVVNNDYIEELDPDHFMGYTIHDISLYTRLKYMLNSSYKNIINNI